MAVDADQIRTEFAEFADLTDPEIDPKIADAVQMVATETWGDATDFGVKYMACHLLAISPLGEQAKLDTEGETVYLKTFNAKKSSVASGCRVI